MHADGTLSELSIKWFGEDLTKKVGADETMEGDMTAEESMAPEDGGE